MMHETSLACYAACALALVGLLEGCEAVIGLRDLDAAAASDAASDAAPVEDAADGATCGTLGEPCCGGATCTDGTQCMSAAGRTKCAAFAGTWEKTDPNACGQPQCLNPNPLSASCQCPGTFPTATSALDVACGASATLATHQSGLLGVCAIDTMPPKTDWGGAYIFADIPQCAPNSSPEGCVMANPITNACSCPTGATLEDVSLRVFVEGVVVDGGVCPGAATGGILHVCLNHDGPPTSIAGVFQRDGANVCRSFSSTLTGCACPSNTTSAVRSVQEGADGGNQFPSSTITFCIIPP